MFLDAFLKTGLSSGGLFAINHQDRESSGNVGRRVSVALDSYREIPCAAGDYPVEIDPSDAELFRRHIRALRKMLKNAVEKDDFQTQASFAVKCANM